MKRTNLTFIVLLAILVLVIVLARYSRKTSPVSIFPMYTVTNTPTPIPDQTFTSDSGDGKVLLTQTNRSLATGNIEYIFKVTDKSKGTDLTVFDQTNPSDTVLSIPVNSWSPDNKQFFLIEKSPTGTGYLVFKADGSSYSNNLKFLDIGSYWIKSKINYTIRDVTGWASGDLLYVYTSKADGTNGPAFWFVTSSKSFLQLRS